MPPKLEIRGHRIPPGLEGILSSKAAPAETGSLGLSALLPVFVLSYVSGAISLGYQVMWFRIFAQRFGSTNLTFLLVLVSFIGGLGLGALLSERLSRRVLRSKAVPDPLTLVGGIEVAIALTALSTLLFDPSGFLVSSGFPYVADARGFYEPVLSLRLEVVLASLVMLLPTFLMGTTFPILCHIFRARSVFPSELYAWNTFGACTGVLASEFILLPALGHQRAFLALAGLNVLVGMTFWFVARQGPVQRAALALGGAAGEGSLEPDVGDSADGAGGRGNGRGGKAREREDRAGRRKGGRKGRKGRTDRGPGRSQDGARRGWGGTQGAFPVYPVPVVLAVAALSGFLSGALEVDMFRTVRFAGAITDAAMSFTSFWAIVAIFLASWTVRAMGRPRPRILRLAVPAALVAYGAVWLSLSEIRGFFNQIFTTWAEGQIQADPTAAFSASVYPLSGSLPLLLGFTGLVVFPAYFFVSLLLPTVCNVIQGKKNHLGLAYGLNTLAFCAGAVLFTWSFPSQSIFYAVKLVFVFLAAGVLLSWTFRPQRALSRVALVGAGAVLLAGISLVPRGFDPSLFPPDELPARYPVRAMKSNAVHTTFVVEAPQGDMLFFDSHPMSGTGPKAQRYMSLMAHVPLLAHPDPRRALLICYGVGNTARAIASHESIDAIDVVDLNDKVFETAPEFWKTNGGVHEDPRIRFIHDDGRRFLDRAQGRYDLVTSEPPPPRAQGVYRLYSVEYYRSVLEHLTPQGMMTQWLPVNQLAREAIDRIVASFVEVFPEALLFVGSDDQLILLGGREPFDARVLEYRFDESVGAAEDLAALGIADPVSILARILRTGEDLRTDVAGARVVSDQRNDLALTVTDPFDPPSLRFEPGSVLGALDPTRLENGERLREVFTDLRLLRAVVPDFPGS